MTRYGPSRRNYRNATGGYGHWSALQSLGPVVYAIRLDDGVIKIGFTSDLADRQRTVRARSGSSTAEILAFTPGTHDDEQAIDALLDGHQAYGQEYYHPRPEVLAVVNAMRHNLGLSLVS